MQAHHLMQAMTMAVQAPDAALQNMCFADDAASQGAETLAGPT